MHNLQVTDQNLTLTPTSNLCNFNPWSNSNLNPNPNPSQIAQRI